MWSERRFTRMVRMMVGRWGLAIAVSAALLAAGAVFVQARRAGPVTALHYAPNANFDAAGHYVPGNIGFNLADVGSPELLTALPAGVRALVWVGQCDGVTAKFRQSVAPYIGHANVFGFYLMDDPDPRLRITAHGLQRLCTAQHLNEESAWIHGRMPGAITFVVLMNLSSRIHPSYIEGYDATTLHVDLVGVAPYPCRTELKACDYRIINRYVAAVEAAGFRPDQIVPVYQSFGGGDWPDGAGGTYALPSAQQERRILQRWQSLLRHPKFDYAYSWGSQRADHSLENSVALRTVFDRHNHVGGAFGWSTTRSVSDFPAHILACNTQGQPHC